MTEHAGGAWSRFWGEVDALKGELARVQLLCSRLKWTLGRHERHGGWWCARKMGRKSLTIRAPNAAAFVAALEHVEVERRAARIEREVTREACAAAGFKLKDSRAGTWWAVHRDSHYVLEAPSAGELRAKLRAFTRDGAAPTPIEINALPWAAPEEVLEVANG